MSHNIWGCDRNQPAWAERGEDCSAEARMPGMARVYTILKPDVIGLQEATHHVVDALWCAMREVGLNYAVHWVRYTAIFYRPEVFEVVDSDYIPYPETMEGYEGSFNDVRSKSLNLAVLRVKETGKLLIVGNTHLWWKKDNPDFIANLEHVDGAGSPTWYLKGSDAARVYQVELASEMLSRYEEKYKAPSVFLGDMNCPYPANPIRRALSLGFLHAHDIATEYASEENGYHYCFGDGHRPYEPQPFETAIDHILLRGKTAPTVRRFDRFTPDWYEPLSDHSAVYADIEL
jgi:endonuclease/exonuclease/phosphatase family metal-dependent hydrolase